MQKSGGRLHEAASHEASLTRSIIFYFINLTLSKLFTRTPHKKKKKRKLTFKMKVLAEAKKQKALNLASVSGVKRFQCLNVFT